MARAEGSLAARLKAVEAVLAGAGVPSPDVDALALVALVAGVEASELRTAAARGDTVPADFDQVRLDALIGRRASREPLQHLVGSAPFRRLELQVGPGVFIPRPETELVAQAAIDAITAVMADGGEVLAVDLCTGSGAMALAMAVETSARVWAVELDGEAFEYLERNRAAQPKQVAERVTLVRGDARTALAELDGRVDVVAANPPYIPGGARPRDPEVALHDPPVALYGLGEDGLAVPRGIIAAAARLLRPGGVFVMEHGAPQAAAVRAAAVATGAFTGVETRQDLVGWDRFLHAVRVPAAA